MDEQHICTRLKCTGSNQSDQPGDPLPRVNRINDQAFQTGEEIDCFEHLIRDGPLCGPGIAFDDFDPSGGYPILSLDLAHEVPDVVGNSIRLSININANNPGAGKE